MATNKMLFPLLIFIQFCLLFNTTVVLAGTAVSLPQLTGSEILNRREGEEPLCVLFVDNQTDYGAARRFFTLLRRNLEEKLVLHPGIFIVEGDESPAFRLLTSVPAIKCFSYWLDAEPEFNGPFTRRALKDLTQRVLECYNSRIHLVNTEDELRSPALQHEGSFILLVVFQDLRSGDFSQTDLLQLRDEYESVQFFIHQFHGGGHRERDSLSEEFAVRAPPAAVLIKGSKEHMVNRVEGPFKFLERVEEMLITEVSQPFAETITQDIFHSWLSSDDTTVMYLLCVHAVWAENNLAYLRTFSAASEVLGQIQTNLGFGFVNIEKDREILAKHINPKLIKTFPCTVLLWKSASMEGGMVHQALLPQRPTPWSVSQFLESRGLSLVNGEGKPVQYSPWESENACQSLPEFTLYQPDCTLGPTNESLQLESMDWSGLSGTFSVLRDDVHGGDESATDYGEEQPMKVNTEDLQIDGIRRLTDAEWSLVIEQSAAPSTHLVIGVSGDIFWGSNQPRTILVVFIREQCRSCENNMELFRKISSNLDKLGTGDFYIHNCTSDGVTCDRQAVRGFPTLLAFRNFGRERSEKCVSDTSRQQQYLRMDYHGVLNEKLIMEWYQVISTPVVQHTTRVEMEGLKQVNDVSLSATLYPLSLARKYLPTISGPNSWYPYECFQLACDWLYGRTHCYSILSENLLQRDATENHVYQDMVVTQVEMYRRDDVSAVVFSLGKSLIATLQNEDNIELHRFHTPHRYALKSGQRCEDNHAACTDVIVSFVQDHSRLPVTHITASAFHTHSSISFGRDHSSTIFGAGLPVVLVLATSEQLENEPVLQQVLQNTAYQFYSQLVFAALNVDEFPQWAARFVPVGYYRQVVENDRSITEDNVPSLFIYPRVCIVTEGNHRRAVFYPRYGGFTMESRAVGRTFTKSAFVAFLSQFFLNPDEDWTQTELF